MTAFEIILDIEEMDRGESRFFPEGRFQIHLSSRGFYHFSGCNGVLRGCIGRHRADCRY